MKNIFLIGIGGTGLSAIARVLLEKGYRVSGSDRTSSPFTDELNRLGIKVFIGHAAENIKGADIIIRSSAIKEDNPEVQAALAANIPVYKRSEFLGKFLSEFTCLAVAGTHGKTTTTAMLAWVLSHTGSDPSYIIGGVSKNLGNNAHAGKSPYFVIEADEYDGMFMGLHPQWAIVTNMEHDHPDCYPTLETYLAAFGSFVSQVKPDGGLMICGDEPGLAWLKDRLDAKASCFTYGLGSQNDYSISDLQIGTNGNQYTVVFKGQSLIHITVPQPGDHNLRNSLAVIAVCHQIGLDLNKTAAALKEFAGTGRRFDITETSQDVTIIDDYGHHPTEIRATLQAARSRFPDRRIWAVWQPHTYSRTMTLMDDFLHSFNDADVVLVTEIYAAREPKNRFSSAQLVEKIEKNHKHFSPDLDEALAYLEENIHSGDVVLVLSAGDANQVSQKLSEYLNHTTLPFQAERGMKP